MPRYQEVLVEVVGLLDSLQEPLEQQDREIVVAMLLVASHITLEAVAVLEELVAVTLVSAGWV
jgi:hypothetical protein